MITYKIIKNRFFPSKEKYEATTIWPCIFTQLDFLPTKTVNHELSHCAQQREMLLVGILLALILCVFGCGWWSLFALPLFFYWYGIEWGIRYGLYRNGWEAYRNIAFEQEAYLNQGNETYTDERNDFAWVMYLGKKSYKKQNK